MSYERALQVDKVIRQLETKDGTKVIPPLTEAEQAQAKESGSDTDRGSDKAKPERREENAAGEHEATEATAARQGRAAEKSSTHMEATDELTATASHIEAQASSRAQAENALRDDAARFISDEAAGLSETLLQASAQNENEDKGASDMSNGVSSDSSISVVEHEADDLGDDSFPTRANDGYEHVLDQASLMPEGDAFLPPQYNPALFGMNAGDSSLL